MEDTWNGCTLIRSLYDDKNEFIFDDLIVSKFGNYFVVTEKETIMDLDTVIDRFTMDPICKIAKYLRDHDIEIYKKVKFSGKELIR